MNYTKKIQGSKKTVYSISKKQKTMFTNPIAESTIMLKRANWTGTKGNRVNYTYYPGIELGNPSGTLDNIKQMIYIDGNGETVVTIEFTYDIADRVISEISF